MIHKFLEAETGARSVARMNWHSSTDFDTNLHHLTWVCFPRHQAAIQAAIKGEGVVIVSPVLVLATSKGPWGMNLTQYSFGCWGKPDPADKQHVFCLFFYRYLDGAYGGVLEKLSSEQGCFPLLNCQFTMWNPFPGMTEGARRTAGMVGAVAINYRFLFHVQQ